MSPVGLLVRSSWEVFATSTFVVLLMLRAADAVLSTVEAGLSHTGHLICLMQGVWGLANPVPHAVCRLADAGGMDMGGDMGGF